MEMDSSCRFTLPQDLELRLSNMHLQICLIEGNGFCAMDGEDELNNYIISMKKV